MLGKRLTAILSHTKGSVTLADIGCDHGMLTMSVLKSGYAQKVIATDVSDKSLSKARTLIGDSNVFDRVEFRCGDGLRVLKKDEVDTVVISGMGGREIVKILSDVDFKVDRLILSPQSDVSHVRKYLIAHGYRLNYDYVLKDSKFYWVIVAEIGSDVYTDLEYEFGRDNLSGKYPEFIEWLDLEIKRFENIISVTQNAETVAQFLKEKERFEKVKNTL